MTSTRQLVAIMFTDIVGYTALMGSDENKAFETLEKNTEIHNKLIAEHKGALIKAIGDGMLVSFNLASDAVRCSIALQKECTAQGIPLKIGIHQGEVVFADADVLGDGVNIASRLQENAEAGSIYISGKVNSDVKNQAEIITALIGDRTFKNVDEPIKVYQVLVDGGEKEENATKDFSEKGNRKILFYFVSIIGILVTILLIWKFLPIENEVTLSEKERSIIVMPFDNESSDEENEYFINGVTEDIRNSLSSVADLRVYSKTTAENFNEKGMSATDIGNEHGINFLLEGTGQKFGNQLKIHVQLIATENEDHLWTETYVRDVSDINEYAMIQTEIAQSVAGELNAIITPEEEAKIASLPTDNAEAYDLYLQASWNTLAEVDSSIAFLEKAIEVDPEFADAYALLGFLKSQFWWFGSSKIISSEEAYKVGIPYFEKALDIDPDNIASLRHLLSSLVLYKWDFREADQILQALNQLDPYGDQWDYYLPFGRFNEALKEMELRINRDPLSVSDGYKILCYYFNNMEEETLKTIEVTPKGANPHHDMAITRVYLFMEMYDEALAVLDQFFESYDDQFINASWPLGFLGVAKYHKREYEQVNEILEKLKKRSEESSAGSPSYCTTMIYAQMGEIDLAFQWLEKAYLDREVEMYWLKVVPLFEPMHHDPRWQEMLDKVGFPD